MVGHFSAKCHGLWPTFWKSVPPCITQSTWEQTSMLFLLVSWITNVLDSVVQTLRILQLSFGSDLEILHFFCELINWSSSHVLIHFLMMWWHIFQLCCWLCVPSMVSFTLTVWLFPLFMLFCQLRGSTKHFPSVHLISQFSPYLLHWTIHLMSTVTQDSQSTARASVMYSAINPVHSSFIYCLRNKDIKSALKILFHMESNRVLIALRLNKRP
jgi:olfactory receptor